MKYACLKQDHFTLDGYSICSLREEDIYKIKDWRNEQMEILRQTHPLTDQDQRNYFFTTVKASFLEIQPRNILLSFLKSNVLIGYGGLVHIDWQAKRGEVSFLLETARTRDMKTHKQDFKVFLKLLKELAFKELDFHKLHTECYDSRPHHLEVLEKEGFVLEGRLKDHAFKNGQFIDSVLHALINN